MREREKEQESDAAKELMRNKAQCENFGQFFFFFFFGALLIRRPEARAPHSPSGPTGLGLILIQVSRIRLGLPFFFFFFFI